MKKLNVKEVCGVVKEKGKKFYEKHKLFIGYAIGVCTMAGIVEILDKVYASKYYGVDVTYRDDTEDYIGLRVFGIDKFGNSNHANRIWLNEKNIDTLNEYFDDCIKQHNQKNE